jgi:hypothetical protein
LSAFIAEPMADDAAQSEPSKPKTIAGAPCEFTTSRVNDSIRDAASSGMTSRAFSTMRSLRSPTPRTLSMIEVTPVRNKRNGKMARIEWYAISAARPGTSSSAISRIVSRAMPPTSVRPRRHDGKRSMTVATARSFHSMVRRPA